MKIKAIPDFSTDIRNMSKGASKIGRAKKLRQRKIANAILDFQGNSFIETILAIQTNLTIEISVTYKLLLNVEIVHFFNKDCIF